MGYLANQEEEGHDSRRKQQLIRIHNTETMEEDGKVQEDLAEEDDDDDDDQINKQVTT